MLKVRLFSGKIVETVSQSFVVKFWNAGSWNNFSVHQPDEYDKADDVRKDLLSKGYTYVEIVQVF